MKKVYVAPQSEIIYVRSGENMMQQTSRNGEVGNNDTPNSNKEHYNDPTGPISGQEGGESLAKGHTWGLVWED